MRSNIKSVIKNLERRGDAAGDIATDELRKAAKKAVKTLQNTGPKNTGNLRRSWTERNTKEGADVVNGARYARYVKGGEMIATAERVIGEEVETAHKAIAKRLKRGN